MTRKHDKVIDWEAREIALDISRSFAVQAPAGSGKTELLSLRFLRLLAVCQQPEEVLAITFTKKAANEMAERILNTLKWASTVDTATIEKQLDRDRYAAAQSVLAQDQEKGWLLLQSPNRLRIQTIDSFCHFLASRLPVLSNFGSPLQLSEEIDDCYSIAVQECLKLLDADSAISQSIAELMRHFDNDNDRINNLLQSLLKQREQWVREIIEVASSPEEAFAYLNNNLRELIEESLFSARDKLLPFQSQLIPLLRYAIENLQHENSESALFHYADKDTLPDASHDDFPDWLAITELLLTKEKSKPAFRKQVDKKLGFPAPSGNKEQKQLCSSKKQDMKDLLEELSTSSEALQALDFIRRLPQPDKDDVSWNFLATLTAILPTLLAQLELAFSQKNKIDYPQVSLAALRALGSEEKPTDLALSLDYHIKHILVDEFQDTSSTQMNLLHKLTAGWEFNDGRTLFVVGDGMQSCYGFRNADVGLFIKLRERGIRDISIEPVDLKANFRSEAGVVDWVNRIFSGAFPKHNDISRGAVTYSNSVAVHPLSTDTAVSIRCYQHDENSKVEAYLEEANYIAEEIHRFRKINSKHKIAILVRSRPHLELILPALREAGVPWLANELDKLSTVPLITDILSLTNAICNQSDRLSWLAILRAPWCGIQLRDLHEIANWNREISTLECLNQLTHESNKSTITADGLNRIRKITPALNFAIQEKEEKRLSQVIPSLFIALGGKQLMQSEIEYESLNKFYKLIRNAEISGKLENLANFQRSVEKSFISNSPESIDSNPVQVMTIHKAKGLEFDHVFLPGLARSSRADDKSLLLWHQRLDQFGNNKLFLATLSATGSEDNSLYNLLKFEKAEKSRFESTRLLYIGVTRAIKSVHLSAALTEKDGKIIAPGSRTLLHTIWDSLLSDEEISSGINYISIKPSTVTNRHQQDPIFTAATISRLPSPFFENAPIPETVPESTDNNESANIDFTQDNLLQKQVGNLIHEALQFYVNNPKVLNAENLPKLQHRWHKQLCNFGFTNKEIKIALTKIQNSLQKTVGNDEISWVFDSTLTQSAVELSMQTVSNGYIRTHILDRTFIDKQGQRWIIDYKSSDKPQEVSLSDFLQEQMQEYAEQLSRYKFLFSEESNNGIKTALLFTSLSKLVEYD
jgi:ATP-dependent exoDNAse (exonuclease V) beta subunit